MKATQFIKDHGLNTFRISMGFVNTKKYVVVHEGELDFTDEIRPHHGNCVFERSEVQRLVESVDRVKKIGGIGESKKFANSSLYFTADRERMHKAIADYESIYGEGNE